MSMRMNEDEVRAIIARIHKVTGRNPVAAEVGGGKSTAAAVADLTAPPKKRGRCKSGPSELELMFAKQLSVLELPAPQREFKFHHNRDWRFDYCWPEKKIAVEVQGMPHRIRERFLADVEKLAMAQIHGWRVLLVAGQDVRSGRAVSWLVTLWEMK